MSTPSVNAARSSVAQRLTAPGTTVSDRGAGRPRAHERCMSQAMSSAPAGTASSPLPATSMSRWRTSEVNAANSARTAAGASLPSTGDAASTQRSSTLRPDTSMPRKTSLSDIDRPIRWRCSPSRKPSQPSAPATSGRRPSALLSNDSAHMCTGYGRVVTRRCTHRPCSSPSCAAIWRISTSRWESLRKLHACAARRYQAMTWVDVRVRWPSIPRNAMSGVYFGRFVSPASARPRRARGTLSRLASPRATAASLRPGAGGLHAAVGARPLDTATPWPRGGLAACRSPGRRDAHVAGADAPTRRRGAGARAGDLVPEQGEHLPQRALVVDAAAEVAGDRDGDEQGPRDGEEVETDTEPPLHEHDGDHDEQAHAVAHVAGSPGKRGARWPQPYGVDAVDLVVGSDEHVL